jgi:diaminopimelate decarboxylase
MRADPPLPEPFGRQRGELTVEGLPLREIAETHGTPLYVTSEARIRANARRLLDAFRGCWPEYRLLYALKANPNPAIVRILRSEGAGADCSSPAEIRIAREAGVAAADCLYTGAYPSDADLSFALRSAVPINLDDPALLPRLLALGRPAALSFRVNPGRTSSGPEGLKFAGRTAKFGVPLASAMRGLAEARREGVSRLGLHTMPGSNVLDPEHFERVGRFLGRAVRSVRRTRGIDLEFLDAGGGFGVPYRPGETPLDIGRVAARLTGGIRSGLGAGGGAPLPRLCNEPGRYLLADSTVLVTRVTHIKAGRVPFVGVDAGMHTLLRPALYQAYHPIQTVGAPGTARATVTVVGPVCENTDVLALRRSLPRLAVGDLIAITNAGAYGFSMSSQYNTRPRPAEVLVRNGQSHVIRAAEGFEEIVARTRIPAHLSDDPAKAAPRTGAGR